MYIYILRPIFYLTLFFYTKMQLAGYIEEWAEMKIKTEID